MHVKATQDAKCVIIESGDEKVIIAQTPFGVMVSGEEGNDIQFTPIEEVNEELLISEFGAETAEKIGTCLGIVMSQIAEQIQEMEDTIDVDGEEVEPVLEITDGAIYLDE